MTNGRSFPFSGLTGKSSRPPEISFDFIELLPTSAILIDERSGRIEAANLPFCTLTSAAAADLIGQEVGTLLPGWESGSAPVWLHGLTRNRPGAALPTAASESLHSQTVPLAKVTSMPALPKGKRVLMIQTPVQEKSRTFAQQGLATLWEGLNRLMGALQESTLERALETALEAMRSLTGADTLAIYRLQSSQPVLTVCAEAGKKGLLPAELPAQELIQLNRARVWEAGKRPTCLVQRQARSAQLGYLLTAPLGQARAVVGLAAVGGRELPKTGMEGSEGSRQAETALPLAELLANAVTAIFQQHAQVENQHARIEAQQRRMRMKAVLEDHSLEGTVVLDPELRIVRMNPAAELMMGYAGEEVVGQSVDKVLIGPENLLPALNEALEGSPTYQMGNVRLFRRNGEGFLAQMRIFPVDHAGRVEHLLVLLQDLSEQEQIRLQTQQLEQRALLGEVTAVFAHEVRNPINNISTGLQVMAMNLSPEDPNQAAITRMLQDCDRLAELMRSVLAFAKPAEYEMEPLDVGPLINRLLERQHPRIVKANVQYNLRVEENCPKIMGNGRALEQVFTNLVGNAVQAMSEAGGHLIIKVSPVSDEAQSFVEVSVADTGPGIPRELQERVFQPFFTTEKGGTGLGLAIVRRIVTAHKGNISLTSFPGGTIFRVRMPAI